MANDTIPIPDSFCVVPWISLHVNTQSKRKLCCATSSFAPKEFQNLTAEEFSRSNYLQSIRQQMLQGEWPQECVGCQKYTPKTLSYQHSLNQRYADVIPQILQGSQSNFFDVLYLDYREKTCNLKCKTCGPESSSSWATYLQNSDLFRQLSVNSEIEYKKATSLSSNYTEFLPLIKESKNLRHIYFAGGEPLLSKEHLLVLEYLAASGRSKAVTLLYNSNLMHSLSTLERMTALWENFHEVRIFVSIDGVGEVGEYIRTGLRNETIFRNFEFLLQQGKRIPLKAHWDVTATSLLFSQLIPMAMFLLEYPSHYQIRSMHDGDWKAKFLRLEFLSIAERRIRVQSFEEFYQGLAKSQQDHLFRFRQFLNKTLDLPEFSNEEYEIALEQLFFHEIEFGPPPTGSILFRSKEQRTTKVSADNDEQIRQFHEASENASTKETRS